jgi:hypothetical protein
MSEAVRYQSLHQIAEILSVWYLEPAYLDEQGLPRALPLSGTKSFSTLCRRFLPRSDSREIADMLIAERLLLHRSDGCVIPLQRAARFASDSALMLDRIPMLFHALSSTLRHNARARSVSTGTRCEQGTVIARLPVEAIPAFNEHVKKLGHTLLNQTDAWASQRQEAPESEGRKVARVGVEVFAYVETEPPSRRGKRR